MNGNEILSVQGASFTGNSIILCVRAQSGYESGIQKYKDENGVEHTNPKEYEERYYIVNFSQTLSLYAGKAL